MAETGVSGRGTALCRPPALGADKLITRDDDVSCLLSIYLNLGAGGFKCLLPCAISSALWNSDPLEVIVVAVNNDSNSGIN